MQNTIPFRFISSTEYVSTCKLKKKCIVRQQQFKCNLHQRGFLKINIGARNITLDLLDNNNNNNSRNFSTYLPITTVAHKGNTKVFILVQKYPLRYKSIYSSTTIYFPVQKYLLQYTDCISQYKNISQYKYSKYATFPESFARRDTWDQQFVRAEKWVVTGLHDSIRDSFVVLLFGVFIFQSSGFLQTQ